MLNRRTAGPVSNGDSQVSNSLGEIELACVARFRLGDLDVHPSTLQIEKSGLSKTLEPRVMQVLVALARCRGSVVSRDQLVNQCWGGLAVSDDAINRCLAKVRRIGTELRGFEVDTIPRVGYRLRERDHDRQARDGSGHTGRGSL